MILVVLGSAGGLLLVHFHLLPAAIWIEILHGLRSCVLLFAEVLLVNNSIRAHHKGLYARGTVFRRIRHKCESARRVTPLPAQHLKEISAIRGQFGSLRGRLA